MKKEGCGRSEQLQKISRIIPIIGSPISVMIRLIFLGATSGTPFIRFLESVAETFHSLLIERNV